MPAVLLHFLVVVALPVVMATTEPLDPVGWEALTSSPPPSQSLSLYQTDATDSSSYCQMLLESGAPPDQIPWFCLCTQCQNNQGPKGSQGPRGLPGTPGGPGRRGMTGARGPPGFVGRLGAKGQKGDDGDKGDQGPQGPMGPKGGRGFKGEKGEQGLEGRQGDQGPKGDDGVCPDNCEASQGPPGPSGLPGPAGARGLPGTPGVVGHNGLKGDVGDVGHPGVPGPGGEKGDQGPQGECNCTDGLDGSPGQRGDKGDKGDEGRMGPEGQTGLHGVKGDMGAMGMRGPPGLCMPSIQSAFAAGLTSSFPPPNAPVVFSHVLYNVQGHYDPGSGLYTAPVNGTYVFSYHLTVYDRVLKVGLFWNFIPVVKTTEPKVLGTTSQSVVLHLSRGDRVWVQVKDVLTNGMYAGSEASTTFSGFLLHPDTCDLVLLRAPIPPMKTPDGGYTWGSTPESTSPPPPGGSP
ncbi:complement C1q and tumor necrosis factor-related protein 9 isoform X2 [Mugil cephalus]|nr:complement C1q and tumor necrosis factor-related protein 9 isoform X2 [Mugil cephalus]